MTETQSGENKSRSKAIRALAVVVIVIAALVIVFSMLIFPHMENFFLRRGLDYAQIKILASLPSIDGYNPEIHPADPLVVGSSLTEIRKALDIGVLADSALKKNSSDFMSLFNHKFNDQLVVPEEQARLAAALNEIVVNFCRQHFNKVRTGIIKHLEALDSPLSAAREEVLGFDSIAIFSDQIKMEETGPTTMELINTYYTAIADNDLSFSEADSLVAVIGRIERFQLYNELQAVIQNLIETPEFKSYENAERFLEYVSTINSGLRNLDFDYLKIKPTLRSFIVLWHAQKTNEDIESFDLEPLYRFLEYAQAEVLAKSPDSP